MLDYIHGFYTRKKDLRRGIHFLKNHHEKDGMIMVSWPEGNSVKAIDLTREIINKLVFGKGHVDVKICAVFDVRDALMFVFRTKDRI